MTAIGSTGKIAKNQRDGRLKMELKLRYEPVSKEELVGYAKDTLTLMRQNLWLTLKLAILGMLAAFAVGFLIYSPDLILSQLSWGGYQNPIILALYETFSDCLWVLFTIAPFWLLLFFTGFRLMENGQSSIPFWRVVGWNLGIIKAFWSLGFSLIVFAILLFINFMFLENQEQGSDSYSKLLESLTPNGETALWFYSLASKSMAFGLGIYWFSFVPLLMYQALLHGSHILPPINKASTMAIMGEGSPWRRLSVFMLFIIVDTTVSVALTAIAFYFTSTAGFIAVAFLRGLVYVFIAGVLYNYCVDKIEGRKVKKKVTESVLSGREAPNPA